FRATPARRREGRKPLSGSARPSLHRSRDGTCGTTVHFAPPFRSEICPQRKRTGRWELAGFLQNGGGGDPATLHGTFLRHSRPPPNPTAPRVRERSAPSNSAGRSRETSSGRA